MNLGKLLFSNNYHYTNIHITYTFKTIKISVKLNFNRIINRQIKIIYWLSNLFLYQIDIIIVTDIYVMFKNMFAMF